MPLHDILAIEVSIAEVAGKPSLLLVGPLDMLLEIMVERCLVAANMAHFKVTFFRMAVAHMLLQAFLQCMSIITLVALPRFLRLMLVHDVLLDMLVVLQEKKVIEYHGYCFARCFHLPLRNVDTVHPLFYRFWEAHRTLKALAIQF